MKYVVKIMVVSALIIGGCYWFSEVRGEECGTPEVVKVQIKDHKCLSDLRKCVNELSGDEKMSLSILAGYQVGEDVHGPEVMFKLNHPVFDISERFSVRPYVGLGWLTTDHDEFEYKQGWHKRVWYEDREGGIMYKWGVEIEIREE